MAIYAHNADGTRTALHVYSYTGEDAPVAADVEPVDETTEAPAAPAKSTRSTKSTKAADEAPTVTNEPAAEAS